MPFENLELAPGINTQLSRTLTGRGYSSSQLIRWMYGQPQKYGGWQRLTSTPLVGICRGMHAWSDLSGNGWLACGTDQRLEVYFGGSVFDITPLRATTNPAVSFTTTNGSANVSIHDVANGVAVGDWVNLVVPVSVGGIVLYGFYRVVSVTGPDDYVVTAASAATSGTTGGAVPSFTTAGGSGNVTVTLNNHGLVVGNTFNVDLSTTASGITLLGPYAVVAPVTANTFVISQGTLAGGVVTVFENGGNARIQYLLPSGLAVNTPASGTYGVGTYGTGIYGIGSSTTLLIKLREWYLSSWGQQLVGNPTNGAMYSWTPPNTSTPAAVISGTPTMNTASFVMEQAQILVCLGAESGGTQYPNLVRWSTVADYTQFTPTATNQAGSFQIPTGSQLITGKPIGLGALLWTDTDLWSMNYQGLPFVFDFQKIGNNCECLSGRSVGVLGQMVVWPSQRGFFQYNGAGVSPLPCPVWDFFFNNVDLNQTGQVHCAVNTLFNEMAWFFPFNDGSGTIGYVKYNALENLWDIGSTLVRTSWVDHSVLGNPVGVDGNGILQQHEVTNDADGNAMVSSITTGLGMLGDGETFIFADAFWPDVVTNGTSPMMSITFESKNAPNDNSVTYGPYAFSPSTSYVPIRVRGRELGYTLQSADLGSFWRMGRSLLRVAGSGRR